MISRIWHGWTTHENADAYEALLKDEICMGSRWCRQGTGVARLERFAALERPHGRSGRTGDAQASSSRCDGSAGPRL